MKYLIRYLEKWDYVTSLLEGKLYMHRAGYYQALEDKSDRADANEGRIGENYFQNLCLPILCMTEVAAPDDSDFLLVPRQLSFELCPRGGYAVVFEEEDVIKALETSITREEIEHGPISYIDDYDSSFQGETYSIHSQALFKKDAHYRYQSEYRFVFHNPNEIHYPLDTGGLKQPYTKELDRSIRARLIVSLPNRSLLSGECRIQHSPWMKFSLD